MGAGWVTGAAAVEDAGETAAAGEVSAGGGVEGGGAAGALAAHDGSAARMTGAHAGSLCMANLLARAALRGKSWHGIARRPAVRGSRRCRSGASMRARRRSRRDRRPE